MACGGFSRGFSIVELMMVAVVLGVLAVAGVPIYRNMISDTKVYQYGSGMEHLAKYAKIFAMEKTRNVGICVTSSQITLYDLGTTRSSTVCTGTQITYVHIPSQDVSRYGLGFQGTSVSVDPRGIVIYPGMGGSVCLTNARKYHKVSISRVGMRTSMGSGGCP
jgi:prepilin-type N-terminal cleavage/methylation domain-containing protein